jgi:acetyl-CoA carboxylase biotin carboxyl carrier protein
MNVAAVKQLIDALERSSLTSLSYEDGEVKITLSREFSAAKAAPAAHLPHTALHAPETMSEPEREGFVVVRAPIVGTAYRAREPGAPPLVSVGDIVREGDALCVIEAMKFFSDITAPSGGKVTEIAFEDGALAEYGATLVVLEAAE